jgi:YHS domain-containing protein
MNALTKGSTEFSSTYDGRTYVLESVEDLKTFDANPAAFVPALGGNCVVSKSDKASIVSGKAAFHVVYDARLHLFPSANEQKMFEAEPEKYANADLTLGGMCAVNLRNRSRRVPGKPEIVSIYDARRYLFASAEEKAAFDASPAAYAPVLWGNCAVCNVEEGKDVPGIADYHLRHGHRMYVFSSAEHKALFISSIAKYANADIALKGNCPVCRLEHSMDMHGTSDCTVDYLGRRYFFSSWDRRKRFLANPDKYAVKE